LICGVFWEENFNKCGGCVWKALDTDLGLRVICFGVFGDGFDGEFVDGFGDGFDGEFVDGFGDGFDGEFVDGFGDGFDGEFVDGFDGEFVWVC
jgi:hypothetical protein